MFENLFGNKNENENKNLFNSNVEEDSSESYVNFKNNNDNKLHLFMFYAPWCGYCKRKKPFLNNLINNHSNKIRVHTFNCEKLKEKDKFIQSINGFPTFKMGYKKTYNIDLLEFMLAAVAITTKATIQNTIQNIIQNTIEEMLKKTTS